MRVISNKALVDFANSHPDSSERLLVWRKLVEKGTFGSFADLKHTFNSVDKVGDYYVFNVGGNNFRVVAAIYFDKPPNLLIRHVLTHSEYDKWKPK